MMKCYIYRLIVPLVACTLVTESALTVILRVTQDVSIENSWNYNFLQYLLVGTHRGWPLKRSLIQFQPLQVRGCTRVKKATMYLYYAYAHKASFMTEAQVPPISRTIVAHQVLKSWLESQATKTRRYNGANWAQPWLKLGTDALTAPTSCGVIITPYATNSGFVAIDVTSAVRNWKSGHPNYGFLIRATNEHELGRDFRFYSNAEKNKARHAYISVTCDTQ